MVTAIQLQDTIAQERLTVDIRLPHQAIHTLKWYSGRNSSRHWSNTSRQITLTQQCKYASLYGFECMLVAYFSLSISNTSYQSRLPYKKKQDMSTSSTRNTNDDTCCKIHFGCESREVRIHDNLIILNAQNSTAWSNTGQYHVVWYPHRG